MSVIARDAVASDHLVYAWPFPIGPEEYEVACAADEHVVICPSWVVGGMFGPGRHRYRSPNPMQPTAAYFVLTSPVDVSFDFATVFQLPATGAAVRVRSAGSVQVRCSDASLLIAQFVGLPFDAINEDIVRSVSRSVERMLARLLTRRVVIAGTARAVTDPEMLGTILEELVAYNPAAGAVFGVELVRMGHVSIAADDGMRPMEQMFASPPSGTPQGRLERSQPAPRVAGHVSSRDDSVASGEIRVSPAPLTPRSTTFPPLGPNGVLPTPPAATADATLESRGAILGIGMAHIGSTELASGEIPQEVVGARVLVPGPDGLMQSATVRQLLQGYYELEVGGSGETIWVPVTGVVPES